MAGNRTGRDLRRSVGPSGNTPDQTLKIVIVDESEIRAAILKEGLREAGYVEVVHIAETTNLLDRIYAIDPERLTASA